MHKTDILLCSVLVLVKLNFVHCCAYRKLLVIKLQLVLKGADRLRVTFVHLQMLLLVY